MVESSKQREGNSGNDEDLCMVNDWYVSCCLF